MEGFRWESLVVRSASSLSVGGEGGGCTRGAQRLAAVGESMSAITDLVEAGLTEYGLLSKRERRCETAKRRIGRHPTEPPQRRRFWYNVRHETDCHQYRGL